MRGSPSTVSKGAIDYVFVKLKTEEKKPSAVKRVAVAPTFKAFRKACAQIFKDVDPITAFYDCEGNLLTDITAVTPGTTILATTDPKAEYNFEVEEQNEENQKPKFNPQAPLLYTKFPDSMPVPVARNPESVLVGLFDGLAMDQARLTAKRGKKERGPKKMKLATEDWLHEEEDEEEEDFFDDEQNAHYFDQDSYAPSYMGSSVMNESVMGAGLALAPGERPKRFEKKAAAKSRLERVKGLIQSLFKNPEMFGLLNQALNSLPEEIAEFVGQVDPCEQKQKGQWFEGMRQCLKDASFCEKLEGLFMGDEMRGFSRSKVTAHRIMCGSFCTHHFNVAIAGPPKSGKSTLLQMMADELSLDFVAADDWKNTFMFLVNMKDFAPYFHTLDVLYLEFVRLLVKQIGQQRLAAGKWVGEIRRYLESLISEPEPLLLSKSYVMNPAQMNVQKRITELGEGIKECWKEAPSLDWWFTSLLNLSLELPAALGFKKTLFVIDNFEYADVQVPASQPFSGQPAYFCEHLKFVITKGDYIIACESPQKLYDAMAPIDVDGIDLFKTTEFITTNGMAKNDVESDAPLLLTLKNEPVPFVMKPIECDGIPNYMYLWRDLNSLIDQMELLPEGSDEREDANYFAVAHAQAIVNLMFCDPESDDGIGCPKILDVRRSSRTEQQNFADEEAKREQEIKAEVEAAAEQAKPAFPVPEQEQEPGM